MSRIAACIFLWGVLVMNIASFSVGMATIDNESRVNGSSPRLNELHISVGSMNSVKIQAVKNAIDPKLTSVHVTGCSASSSVREQPLSDKETQTGALQRAQDCLSKDKKSDIAIGLEAGVVFSGESIYLVHWGVLVDRTQKIYMTNGPLIRLPDEYKNALLSGKTLEEIMHDTTGIVSLGSKQGAVGIFTDGFLTRQDILTVMVKVLLGQYLYSQRVQLAP